MLSLVLATGNDHKRKEFCDLLNGFERQVQFLHLKDFPGHPVLREDGSSFLENALAKARTMAEFSQCLTLADDSGLEVDFLRGAPGIYSARYASAQGTCDDQANNEKLLRELQNLSPEKRTARYQCVLALVDPKSKKTWEFAGTCEGVIMLEPQGKSGFGYDPLFWLPEENATMAEMKMARKNQISHRAKAFAKLRSFLPMILAEMSS